MVFITGRPTGTPHEEEMIEGPFIRFIDSYYRFPKSKEEFYGYFAYEYGDIYSQKQIRKWAKRTIYQSSAPDSCRISGGIFGTVNYVVKETPFSRLYKLNNAPAHGINRREAVLQFVNHYLPVFYDQDNNILLSLRE